MLKSKILLAKVCVYKNLLNNFKKDYRKISNKKIWFLVQIISFLRILMGIIIIFYRRYLIIFFFIGLFADFLDGFLARSCRVTSRFGEILDPIADKFFIYSVFLSLFLSNLSDFSPKFKMILYLIIIKDLIVLSGGLYSRYYFNKAIISKIGKSTMIFMGIFLYNQIIKYHLLAPSNKWVFNLAMKFSFLIKYEELIMMSMMGVIIIYLIQYVYIYYKSFIRR